MDTNQKRNFHSFIWHAVFLALTLNFVDINTVVPDLLLKSGGSPIHLGLLSAIMIGGTGVMQLFFAGFLMNKPRKKGFLISAISLRISALFLLSLILMRAAGDESLSMRPEWILLVLALFAFSGSFAGISYTDILGKAFPPERRKRFFIIKQTISSIGVILSALLVRLVLGRLLYPRNYALLFGAAGLLLLTASIGFWRLREPESKIVPSRGLKEKLGAFAKALRNDPNLRRYLILINTSGITLGLVPFLIGLAGSRFEYDSGMIGNFLIIQMAGALGANLLFNVMNRNQKYKGILYYFILSGALIPPAALLLSGSPALFPLIFLLSGSSLAAYQVSAPGVLLEISSEANRPIYTGISGAGSIAVLIYPVLAGLVISRWSYLPVFLFSSAVIITGLLPARKINCSRTGGAPEIVGEE